MGPIETLFLTVFGIFGAIGIVRGYSRELGVTTMLLLTLFVLTFVQDTLGDQIVKFLGQSGVSASSAVTFYSLFACVVLIIVTFISYQGYTLAFPGTGSKWLLALIVGLINGYLFAGSVWYYLAQAKWPFVAVVPDYTAFYNFLVQLLPPELFSWQYFILLAVGMLILRVIK